jgi:hypothetical protein
MTDTPRMDAIAITGSTSALTDHDLVIRRIHDELIRLQTLKHDSVAVQRRNALLIIR